MSSGQSIPARRSGGPMERLQGVSPPSGGLTRAIARGLAPLAQARVAGLVALAIYLLRASISRYGLQRKGDAYFNYLADAFLHGHLSLRFVPPSKLDLIHYHDKLYLYWPPFPAILIMPLVALFSIDVSDVLYTVACGAVTIALVASLLAALDRTGIAPLTADRRAILVATCAFGSVLLILIPTASVWYTSQVIGLGCVLLATVTGLTRRGKLCYLLVGIGLACATATRVSLIFNGAWLAYYLFRRDYRRPRQWLWLALWAVVPVTLTLLLLGWYNVARFGNPLDLGLRYHAVGGPLRADFERYGMFNLHYLPTNLYYQFVAYNFFTPEQWKGGGLFWMTPVFLGAPYAIWRGRGTPLVWALALSCALIYIPIGLLMGTGYFTFGPRYLLDLMVPLVILTAQGIRRWPLRLLLLLLAISVGTYALGSAIWLVAV